MTTGIQQIDVQSILQNPEGLIRDYKIASKDYNLVIPDNFNFAYDIIDARAIECFCFIMAKLFKA